MVKLLLTNIKIDIESPAQSATTYSSRLILGTQQGLDSASVFMNPEEWSSVNQEKKKQPENLPQTQELKHIFIVALFVHKTSFNLSQPLQLNFYCL